MKINPISNINHKAIPVADIKVKGVDESYKLFSVNFNDREFLDKMYSVIKLEKLLPNLYEYDYVVWDEVLHNAVMLSKSAYAKSILEVYDNKPCGILNYKEYGKNLHLNYIATFPTKPEKRVPCAGQILMNEFFNQFLKSDKKKIELCAVKDSTFSPVLIYKRLGFSMDGGDNYNEHMSISRERVVKTLGKQREFITSTPAKSKLNVDLSKELSLDFKI